MLRSALNTAKDFKTYDTLLLCSQVNLAAVQGAISTGSAIRRSSHRSSFMSISSTMSNITELESSPASGSKIRILTGPPVYLASMRDSSHKDYRLDLDGGWNFGCE
jgi:hypothetical protein